LKVFFLAVEESGCALTVVIQKMVCMGD